MFVLLGKNALAYYKSKESLRTHASSYETVHQWVNAIKNGQEEINDAPLSGAPTSAIDECNMEKVKSVLENMHSIICMAVATEVSVCPANVYHILTNSLEKQKVYAKWIPQALYDDQRTMCVLLASAHQQHGEMKAVCFINQILTVDESCMHSFDLQLKCQNSEWCAQMLPRKKLHGTHLVLKFMLVTFFSQNGLVLDHSIPIGVTVNGHYYCTLLQYRVRLAVHHKQPELLDYGVILLQVNATTLHYCDVQNLVQRWGSEVLAHAP